LISAKLKKGLVFVLVVIAGIIAALVLYFYQFFYQTDQFLPGVAIATVPVGGQDRYEVASDIEAHFDRLYQTPVNFYFREFSYSTTMGEICKKTSIDKVIDEIWEQEQERGIRSKLLNLDGARVIAYAPPIEYNQAVLEKLAEEWNQHIGQPPVDPQLEVDRDRGLIVVPGKEGKQVNIAATWDTMPTQWSAWEELKIPIVVDQVYPSISEEDLKVMGELSSAITWYNSGEIDRTHNLVRAASAINGQVVNPGEVFSFNKTVGARSFETGYRDAMVIVSGRFEPGVGGGICQVSSTLYNSVLKADLEIVERHNHALAVAYIPVGLDATVSWGIQDFRFKNNTDHPIYIRTNTGGGQLTVTIYGHLSNKKRIELTSVVDKVIPFQEIRQEDLTLNPGEEKIDQKGFPGYVARSFKLVYDENGNVAQRTQLATDHYRPLHTLIYTGPVLDIPINGDDDGTGTPIGDQIIPPHEEPDPSSETDATDQVPPLESGEGNE
jgi:vancomycin resistance protein YoaR